MRGDAEREEERELEVLLGVKRDGFWAARKRGGPVHFWYHDAPATPGASSNLSATACSNGERWSHPSGIGKVRAITECRAVCRECRFLVLDGGL